MTLTHLSMLVLSLLGFAALAVATERHAMLLLRHVPAPRWRLLARAVGWLLLAVALIVGIDALDTTGVGIAIWLGWLTIAALGLVFAFPKWPWQPAGKPAPARTPKAEAPPAAPASPRARRWLGWTLLAATAAMFGNGLLSLEPKPLQRDDALRGSVGPWTFTFAEGDRKAPEIADMGVPLKTFHLRFCEACDLDVRHVYLKVNRPRALRAAGAAFEGTRWERHAEIQLPANLRAGSELWLTVVGKDGAVHQVSWPMSAVSPATVAWFERRRKLHENP